MRPADADRDLRLRLNLRLRAAFIAGAEEDSRRRLGRGLTAESWSGCCGVTRATRGIGERADDEPGSARPARSAQECDGIEAR